MKKFIFKIFIIVIWTAAIIGFAFYLPVNRITKHSFLYAQVDKNRMMQQTPAPRIIFVGGSNLSFGLDGQMIKDQLHLNPINTGVVVNLGLKYMLRNAEQYVKPGDVVVLCPEYQQYYGNTANGESELLFVAYDVAPASKKLVSPDQFLSLYKFIPVYTADKLSALNYIKSRHLDTSTINIYDRAAFNKYGDAYIHWKSSWSPIAPYPEIPGKINGEILNMLSDFKAKMNARHARVLLSYPCYQAVSYDNSEKQINAIAQALQQRGLKTINMPKQYRMPDSLFYNTPYHLLRKGVTLRTNHLIGDIKKALAETSAL